MSGRVVVAGTDTGIGKTVFAAALAGALDGAYWKPVQAGLDGESDTDAARRLSGLAAERFAPERYRLKSPLSPHRAAEIDGVSIDADTLAPPACDRPLVIEMAGGLMVPLGRATLFIDIIAAWRAPVILCARTGLGTINHSLLSLEALRARNVAVLGIAFIGEAIENTEATIAALGHVRRLGRLPVLERLDAAALARAFAAGFDAAHLRDMIARHAES